MSDLLTNLQLIEQEKEQKIIPENIKKDITIFGVTGSLTGGLDTSDATALPEDVINPKTAYVNGQKITGSIKTYDVSLNTVIKNNNFKIENSANTMYGMSTDKQYLFIVLNAAEGGSDATINVYKLNDNGEYENIKIISQTELGITIGPYTFSVGAWGLFGDLNKLLLILKNSSYKSNSYGLVFDKSTNEITLQNKNNILSYNAFGWSHTNPVYANIFANQAGLWLYEENSVNKIGNFSYSDGAISNFSCNGNLYSVTQNDGSPTKLAYIKNNTVFKNYTTNDFVCVNTDGSMAFINGVLKNFNINNNTGEYTTSDLDFEITSPTNYVIWFDTLVYAVLYDVNSVQENNYYKIEFYKLDMENKITNLALSTRGIQNHDRSFRNLNSGNFGSGLITTIDANTLQIIYVDKNQLFTNIINRKDTNYYSCYDASAKSENVLINQTFYNALGKITGSMPNNGELNYDVLDTEQIIPAGYTSGGTISAAPMSQQDYDNCLNISNQIIGGVN